MKSTCETNSSCMQKIIYKIKAFIPEIIGLILGAAGGFVLYKIYGCSTGSCPITANPWLSILYGTFLGYLFGSMFNKK